MTESRKIPVEGPGDGAPPERPEPTELELVEESPAPRRQAGAPPAEGVSPGTEGAGREDPALRQERDDLWAKLVRTQAEFENFRKRARREREEFEEASLARFLVGVLEVLDSFDRALDAPQGAGEEGARAFREGMELVRKQLRDLLAREGVEEVAGAGTAFDPYQHEAVALERCEGGRAGEVAEVYRKGYRLRSRLLRAAQVKVCSEGAEGAGND